MALGGYAGKILRVDLSEEKVMEEELDEAVLRKYLGGVGLGAWILYKEVPPTLEWSHPDNRLVIAGGPVSGTKLDGTGSICVVTKGSLTGGPASSQANGFFAAYLRFCGYDAVVFQGAARRWLYLWIEEGRAELRDASHLVGKDTWETEDIIKAEAGKKERQASVYCIGPAGENLVRFAAILGDKGHAAGHNGTGAVMGSKKLKAVAVARGRRPVKIADPKGFDALARESFETRLNDPNSGRRYYDWGTSTLCTINYPPGRIPVRNWSTAFFPEIETFSGPYYRPRWKIKANPCWACRCNHCNKVQVTEGPYTGFEGEEGEYEMMAAFGPLIGQTDAGAATMLSNICDRLGLEGCEAGWIVSMVMELFEKGVITGKDTDGLEMTWGNTEAVKSLMGKIARRQGLGEILAEGVLRASQRLGKEAYNCGIFYENGNTPRTYDLRAGRWEAILDDIVASTGVKELDPLHPEEFGLSASDPFSPKDITDMHIKMKGKGPFRDSMVLCLFAGSGYMKHYVRAVNTVTGWDLSVEEGLRLGERIASLTRAYAWRTGMTPDKEMLSPRILEAPRDGPAQGKSIQPFWNEILDRLYPGLGWDRKSGRPLPETLKRLELDEVIPDLWGEEPKQSKRAGTRRG